MRITGTPQALSLPPFTPAITVLIALNTAVFLIMEVTGVSSPETVREIITWFGLRPSAVISHGWVWQIVTYSVLHGGFTHWFFNMLALWIFGAQIDAIRGPRYVLELFSAGVVGGAFFTIGLSYAHVFDPNIPTVGASAGVYAVLMAFGIFFAENEIILIPLPLQVKAKYFVAFLILFSAISSMQESNGVAHIAHLGGLLFGYAFVKFVPARGFSFELSEGVFVTRNFFQRLKRRRASKRFQVYMSKQQDPKDHIDKPVDVNPPEDITKKNGGGPSGWVN